MKSLKVNMFQNVFLYINNDLRRTQLNIAKTWWTNSLRLSENTWRKEWTMHFLPKNTLFLKQDYIVVWPSQFSRKINLNKLSYIDQSKREDQSLDGAKGWEYLWVKDASPMTCSIVSRSEISWRLKNDLSCSNFENNCFTFHQTPVLNLTL